MSSITYSFIPDEIIVPGTNLQLVMSRNVDSESAQGAVRLFKAGKQIPIIVDVRGNSIQLNTENLSPASYKVSIGKLLDIDGQLLTEPTATSFNVGRLRGTIPNGFRALHVVYLAIGDISTTRLCPDEPAPDGTTYVEMVKAVNVETWKLVHLAFDAQGNQVDGPGLLGKVHERRLAKFGYLDETLWNQLQESADNDVIDIVVWPKIDREPVYEKQKDRMTTGPPPEELESLKVIQRKKATIIDILNHLGATVERRHATSTIPFVSASLRAVDIYKLAKFDNIGLVSYEDSSGVLEEDSD